MATEDKPKIIFVKNLNFYNDAICLYWIGEIHIDESLKNSPILDDIIKHELKHYYLIKKAIALKEQGKDFKVFLFTLYNNLWDFYDSIRIDVKRRLIECKE